MQKLKLYIQSVTVTEMDVLFQSGRRKMVNLNMRKRLRSLNLYWTRKYPDSQLNYPSQCNQILLYLASTKREIAMTKSQLPSNWWNPTSLTFDNALVRNSVRPWEYSHGSTCSIWPHRGARPKIRHGTNHERNTVIPLMDDPWECSVQLSWTNKVGSAKRFIPQEEQHRSAACPN